MLKTEITDSTKIGLKNNGINNLDEFVNEILDIKADAPNVFDELMDAEYIHNKLFRINSKRKERIRER